MDDGLLAEFEHGRDLLLELVEDLSGPVGADAESVTVKDGSLTEGLILVEAAGICARLLLAVEGVCLFLEAVEILVDGDLSDVLDDGLNLGLDLAHDQIDTNFAEEGAEFLDLFDALRRDPVDTTVASHPGGVVGLEVGGDGRTPIVGDDLASELLVGGPNSRGDVMVSGDDGRVGFGAPGDGVLEIVIESLMGFVSPFLDDAVDDLGRGPADGAEKKAFSGEASGGVGDGPGYGDTVAGVGGNEGRGDGVLVGEGFEVGGITWLKAPGACEDERTCAELVWFHSDLLEKQWRDRARFSFASRLLSQVIGRIWACDLSHSGGP